MPVEVAYAYLSDPRNRPEWQSSLARVELLDEGEPRVGMRWRDHTRPGVVPEMEITELDPDRTWAESGRWRAITAKLTLRFSATPAGCVVDVAFRVRGRGVLDPQPSLAQARQGLGEAQGQPGEHPAQQVHRHHGRQHHHG